MATNRLSKTAYQSSFILTRDRVVVDDKGVFRKSVITNKYFRPYVPIRFEDIHHQLGAKTIESIVLHSVVTSETGLHYNELVAVSFEEVIYEYNRDIEYPLVINKPNRRVIEPSTNVKTTPVPATIEGAASLSVNLHVDNDNRTITIDPALTFHRNGQSASSFILGVSLDIDVVGENVDDEDDSQLSTLHLPTVGDGQVPYPDDRYKVFLDNIHYDHDFGKHVIDDGDGSVNGALTLVANNPDEELNGVTVAMFIDTLPGLTEEDGVDITEMEIDEETNSAYVKLVERDKGDVGQFMADWSGMANYRPAQ